MAAAAGETAKLTPVRPALEDQYRSIRNLVERPSPFGNETGELACGEFDPSTARQQLHDSKVLCIGAGGLGCELLKDLALSGFKEIHVTDLDNIDLTNLNRQFLFRMADVGKGKSEVAARFIMQRVPGVVVYAYDKKIQEFGEDFYRQFQIIISGLDNLEARRWMNAKLCEMVGEDEDGDPDPETAIPFIDGGTEGFRGQARVILPRFSACFECHLELFPPQKVANSCTIAETPRKPEHCIQYIKEIVWYKEHEHKYDTDSPDDMRWIFERAQARAEEYGIEGVTYKLTMGVVKNIIPAIASTNAIVSATCALEAFKLRSFCSQTLNNFHLFLGNNGIVTNVSALERKGEGECLACQGFEIGFDATFDTTLSDLVDFLKEEPRLQLSQPTIGGTGVPFYSASKALKPAKREQYAARLGKRLRSLVFEDEKLIITDRQVFQAPDAVCTLEINWADSRTREEAEAADAADAAEKEAAAAAGGGAAE